MGFTHGRRFAHCPYCGTAYADGTDWPLDCRACGETQWRNPLPVAIALQPVTGEDGSRGLVVIRRALPPGLGRWALPGGYVETGEDWRDAAVRELYEETGFEASARGARLFGAYSTRDTLELFVLLPERAAAELPEPARTSETQACRVLGEVTPLAFEGHTRALAAVLSGHAEMDDREATEAALGGVHRTAGRSGGLPSRCGRGFAGGPYLPGGTGTAHGDGV
ncbi:NUDIX domain-containing protein [Streptomyces sp. NPDC096012]|uniref:NUDIX domain-containing protein n=1 Tax=Streptomyces sp. NPDC096012 TaxID=3155684 RepID=UPI00336ABEAF